MEADNDSNSASPPEWRARGPRAGPRDVAGGESAGTDPINAAWGREGDWGGGLLGLQGIHLLHR